MNLKDIRVIAVNVIKLKTDNVDPRRYYGPGSTPGRSGCRRPARLEWRVINDLERLDRILG